MSPRSVAPAAMEEAGTEAGSGEGFATEGIPPSWGVCPDGEVPKGPAKDQPSHTTEDPALSTHSREPTIKQLERQQPPLQRERKPHPGLPSKADVAPTSPSYRPPTPKLRRRDSHEETRSDCTGRAGRELRRETERDGIKYTGLKPRSGVKLLITSGKWTA